MPVERLVAHVVAAVDRHHRRLHGRDDAPAADAPAQQVTTAKRADANTVDVDAKTKS